MPARTIAGRNVVVACDASAQASAAWLLDVIPKLVAQGLRLEDGATFQCGWAPLTLRERAGDLVVCEPEFEDLSRGERADVTTTLLVQAEMLDTTRAVGSEPIVPTYRQVLFVDVGAWTARAVTMTRIRAQTPSDSGWLVVPEGMDSSHTEVARVHELVAKKRAWLAPMALPRGYVIHLVGSRIAAIGTPPGRTLY